MDNRWIAKQEIQEVLGAYAHYADTRQPEKQAALFAPDFLVAVYVTKAGETPVQSITTYSELLEGFRALKQYEQTFHFNGQSIIEVAESGEEASGETYNLAHHIQTVDGERQMMVMAIRYQDRFIKKEGNWLFQERHLYVQWQDTRSLNEE